MLEEHIYERPLAAVAKRHRVQKVHLPLRELGIDEGPRHRLQRPEVQCRHERRWQHRPQLRRGMHRVGEGAAEEPVVRMRRHRPHAPMDL